MKEGLISVIVPVLNEPGIGFFLEKLGDDLSTIIEGNEIILVMGERETLRPEIPRLRNLKVAISYGDGLERAILTGFTMASGEKLIVMDGDGSHDPRDVLRLAGELDRHEMVVGSRFLEGSVFQQSRARALVSRFFIFWARLNGSRLNDPMSGFFGIRRELLNRVRFKPFKWKICLEMELKARPNISEIPIKFSKRSSGSSKSTLMIGIKILFDLINK